MELELFLMDTLKNVIASLPQLFIVITTVVYSLKQIKNTTDIFPKRVDENQKVLVNSFKDSTKQMEDILGNAIDDISEKVNGTLTNMRKELVSYREELLSTRNQINMIVKENKVLVDVICTLLSQDTEKVKQGIATTLVNKISMTKKELEKFPEQLVTDLPILEKALIEARVVVGEDNLNTILDKLGYEKKKI